MADAVQQGRDDEVRAEARAEQMHRAEQTCVRVIEQAWHRAETNSSTRRVARAEHEQSIEQSIEQSRRSSRADV